MACRGLLVFGFLMAAMVLVSSRVAVAAEGELARNDADEQHAKDAFEGSLVNPKTCPYGCGYWLNGRCRICRPPGAGDAAATAGNAAATGDAVGDDKHQCGSRGCCGRFRGHCTHCCHASEAAAGGAGVEAEKRN